MICDKITARDYVLSRLTNPSYSNLTEEAAVALYNTGWWTDFTAVQIAEFQLMEPRLCLPIDVYYPALQEALHRTVWNTELCNPGKLITELRARKD